MTLGNEPTPWSPPDLLHAVGPEGVEVDELAERGLTLAEEHFDPLTRLRFAVLVPIPEDGEASRPVVVFPDAPGASAAYRFAANEELFWASIAPLAPFDVVGDGVGAQVARMLAARIPGAASCATAGMPLLGEDDRELAFVRIWERLVVPMCEAGWSPRAIRDAIDREDLPAADRLRLKHNARLRCKRVRTPSPAPMPPR